MTKVYDDAFAAIGAAFEQALKPAMDAQLTLLTNVWDESKHPRDKDGKWASGRGIDGKPTQFWIPSKESVDRDAQIEELESKAYDEQYEMIKSEYGKKAADNANYGWGVSGDDDFSDIATKVYGVGVLSTYVDYKTGTITHRWSD